MVSSSNINFDEPRGEKARYTSTLETLGHSARSNFFPFAPLTLMAELIHPLQLISLLQSLFFFIISDLQSLETFCASLFLALLMQSYFFFGIFPALFADLASIKHCSFALFASG